MFFTQLFQMSTVSSPSAGPHVLTDASQLRALLRSCAEPLVCVWATADWCVPCKRLQPTWDSVAGADGCHVFGGRVAFAVADLTDEAAEDLDGESLSEALRVSTLPSFHLLEAGGDEVARAEGAAHKRPGKRLHAMLKRFVLHEENR